MAAGRRRRPVTSHAAASAFEAVLSQLQEDAQVHFGAGGLRLVPGESQERPFSHVLRVGVWRDGEERPAAYLFAKVFKAQDTEASREAMRTRVAHDYEATRRVHAWLMPHANLGVVPPVACYPEQLAIVTQEVEGPTLLDYLRSNAAWYPSQEQMEQLRRTAATAGRWIRVFQLMDVTGGLVTVDSLRAYIDVRLQRLVHHPRAAFTADERQRVLRTIDALGDQIDAHELREVTVHGDLALGNLLVSGERIVALDFAMAKHGAPLHDLTRLLVQIELLGVKPHITARVLAHVQQALLAGFDPSLTPDRPLFRLLTLLHRVNHFGSLSINPSRGAATLYNSLVRRQHRRWIAAEISRTRTSSVHS